LRPKTKESLTSLAAVTPKKKETLHIKNQRKAGPAPPPPPPPPLLCSMLLHNCMHMRVPSPCAMRTCLKRKIFARGGLAWPGKMERSLAKQ